MGKKVAILQSNYIPWKGYFDLINSVDEFILFDDAQYTKNDWRNRNIIKTAQGSMWLTIPVRQEALGQRIKDTRVADKSWVRKHWASLSQSYSRADYFADYRAFFERLYLSMEEEFLSDVNYKFIVAVNEFLGIKTRMRWSSEFDLVEGRTERLISLCRQVGATEYVSGPAAQSYFDLALATQNNIKVTWMDYSGYPEYKQLYPPFEHHVTVLDLLFNMGPSARQYMHSFQVSSC